MQKLDVLLDRELRDTLLFARANPQPVTADEVAAGMAVHRNVARSRLERLTRGGLLAAGYERRNGRRGPGAGRPAKTYRVPAELTALELPPRRYEHLIGLLIGIVPKENRSGRLFDVGESFGHELGRTAGVRGATSFRDAIGRVCAGLGTLGYNAAIASLDERQAVIETPTCPLRPAVRTNAEAAEIDRGAWAGLVGYALGGTSVIGSCETHGCLSADGSCRVVLRV